MSSSLEEWKVGDVVVCVNPGACPEHALIPRKFLKKGQSYRVRDISNQGPLHIYLGLEGLGAEGRYWAGRFIKINV